MEANSGCLKISGGVKLPGLLTSISLCYMQIFVSVVKFWWSKGRTRVQCGFKNLELGTSHEVCDKLEGSTFDVSMFNSKSFP